MKFLQTAAGKGTAEALGCHNRRWLKAHQTHTAHWLTYSESGTGHRQEELKKIEEWSWYHLRTEDESLGDNTDE